jgi:hypothetical protein
VVNGVDQSLVVDQVFQALDRGPGHIVDTAKDLQEATVTELLLEPATVAKAYGPRTPLRRSNSPAPTPLLPPECQGAACHARADLAAFAAACAADRQCRQILSPQAKGNETQV